MSTKAKIGKNSRLLLNQIIHGDAAVILRNIPAESVDLIMTSPPYADQRKGSYGGISPDHCKDWFLPISAELLRVLKPTGSFILNIKERVVKGERHPYVLELILAMRQQGWLWTEEYIWHRKNSYPGKWPNRFRDAWERCLHFTKQKQFAMYQENVMVPTGEWAKDRLKSLSLKDQIRTQSKTGSNFGKNMSHWAARHMAYPTNVLTLATECRNTGHSAAFPLALPTWFIQLLTQPGDIVLDPFIGSGTTAVASLKLNRFYIGIEKQSEYVELAQSRLLRAMHEIEDELLPNEKMTRSFS